MPLQWKQKLRAVGGIAKLCQRRNKAGHRAGGRPGQFAPAQAGMNRGIVAPSRARKRVLRTRGDEPSFRKIQRIVLADGREADQMTPTHATKRGYSGGWGNQKYETTYSTVWPSPKKSMSELGRVSRALSRVLTVRNCTRDEGGPFGFGNQVLISSHRKLLRSRAVDDKSGKMSSKTSHNH
jgi:hypothetical protein